MWYTTRYEGFDGPKRAAGSPRTPLNAIWLSGVFSALLRLGFLLELLGLTGLCLSYFGYHGGGSFSYDLARTTEEQRLSEGFRTCLVAFAGFYLLGALLLLLFQSLLSDDASWARGYRAGAKLLGSATWLDVISATLQFIFFCYMRSHYNKEWWAQYTGGGVEWLVASLARLLHSLGSLFYGPALFLVEAYHDNGTNDIHGVLNWFLFTAAAIIEVLVVIVWGGSVGVACNWVAVASALLWALAFEQEVNEASPLLHEAELTNDVEKQVEKFANRGYQQQQEQP